MSGTIIPKLPRNPTDGTEVSDRYGNRWQYTAESNAWISKGVIASYSIATEEQSGLIDPTIFTKLKNLKIYADNYDLTTTLKILPGRDAYWYYFRSSDKLIKFKPEGESSLRIEIDKGRLYQILSKSRRVGPRGQQGDTGPAGRNGLPGTICDPSGGEPCYTPSAVDKNRLDFAIYTPTPLTLDGPIPLPNNKTPDVSVRLFKILVTSTSIAKASQLKALTDTYMSGYNTAQKFSHIRNLFAQRSMGVKKQSDLCDIALSELITSSVTLSSQPIVTIDINPLQPSEITIVTASGFNVDIDKTTSTIVYDPDTQIACGSIFLVEPEEWNIDEWCVKSRQRGPDGEEGEPGECRVKIAECLVDGTNIEATCPIVNVRLDCDRDVLYTTCANLLDEICVEQVRVDGLSETLSHRNTLKSVFAAAQTIIDECKYVYRHVLDLPVDDVPSLEFVHWDPQPGCFTKRHFDRHKFNWIPNTVIPRCDERGTWFSPTDVRPGKYPWDVFIPSTPPPDECNQEDFFYCPNVQDAPCPGEPPPPPPLPPPPPPPPPPSPTRAAAVMAKDVHETGVVAGRSSNVVAVGSRRWNVKS